MAKQRMVNTKFWDDGFIRKLPAGDKLLFLYLITNPMTTIAGCYEITAEQIAFDTKMDEKRVEEAIDRLSKAGKVTYKDEWILVHNFIKNQTLSEKIQKGIETVVNDSPDWVKDTLCILYPYLSVYLNPNLNINSNTKRKASYDARVMEVFEEWKTVLGKKSSLDLKRQTILLARLNEGLSVAELKLVPHGVKKSAWHNGDNPKGIKYLEVSTVFKSREQVEKFIELAQQPKPGKATEPEISQEERKAMYERQNYTDRPRPIIRMQ